MTCPKHGTRLKTVERQVCPACLSERGRKAGLARSERKTAAARANAKRPRATAYGALFRSRERARRRRTP